MQGNHYFILSQIEGTYVTAGPYNIYIYMQCEPCTVLFVFVSTLPQRWELGRTKGGELPRTASELPRITLRRGPGRTRLGGLLWSNAHPPLPPSSIRIHIRTCSHIRTCTPMQVHTCTCIHPPMSTRDVCRDTYIHLHTCMQIFVYAYIYTYYTYYTYVPTYICRCLLYKRYLTLCLLLHLLLYLLYL